eukprot:TRINITY_DN1135_c0_g2_i1.p2 TRINITY_DN1135_c0_g2~~TRINITY_DN1135_c0_g2_i1.p2  ORF type:complete len:160 (+),score=36.32 TRINITY_DN1135_c0_g2_i1:41-481(+)
MRTTTVFIALALAAIALSAAPGVSAAYNVANGDLTSASGWNYVASYCFEAGGFFGWDVYTGGIPEDAGVTLYTYDTDAWSKASASGLDCKDRTANALNSFPLGNNQPDNTTFSSRGDMFFAIANCQLTSGYYVQYHINATSTCDYN